MWPYSKQQQCRSLPKKVYTTPDYLITYQQSQDKKRLPRNSNESRDKTAQERANSANKINRYMPTRKRNNACAKKLKRNPWNYTWNNNKEQRKLTFCMHAIHWLDWFGLLVLKLNSQTHLLLFNQLLQHYSINGIKCDIVTSEGKHGLSEIIFIHLVEGYLRKALWRFLYTYMNTHFWDRVWRWKD